VIGENGNEHARLQQLLAVSEDLDRIHDLDSLLDRILLEARSFTNADAGTIYLVDGDELRFAYNAQSGQLVDGNPNLARYKYLDQRLTIDVSSIAGYVCLTGEAMVIEDAYDLPADCPCEFNTAFDKTADYHTTSMFTLPLKTNQGRTVGVMQLVNALDETTSQPVPFSAINRSYVTLRFGRDAAVAIERAGMTRAIILRMIKMAALRDPKETGPHVNRVAAYSVEIYQRLAEKRGVDATEIKQVRDFLRLAAMMHDVGKIAIADSILKKPGPLSDAERRVMQEHTVAGARLFQDEQSDVDRLSEEIALTHHEHWDGSGYPGHVVDVHRDPIELGVGRVGAETPLYGRIVALADVYDALVSKRAYKEPWDEERVRATIQGDSGTHFDPEVVEAFGEVQDVILAIRQKYVG
jgi:HD-GYP domain-containing protein (c-di-GMP phosphodiesterase class II)